MELTTLQKVLIQELKQQGANKDTVNSVMPKLKTKKQQQEMMDYLIAIRDKTINKNAVILKALEIKNNSYLD